MTGSASVYELPPEAFKLEAGGEWKRAGGRWRGPCPACGGTMEVRPGGKGTFASCFGDGCSSAVVAEMMRPAGGHGHARRAGAGTYGRYDRPPPRPNTPPEAEKATQADSGASGGLHSRLWGRSEPVPLDYDHPARWWSAQRDLWPDSDPWPEAVRWIGSPRKGDGSLVAAFAPLDAWTTMHPPNPTGVQLIHVDEEGSPRKDPGGLSKRSHGKLAGCVSVVGPPLWQSAPMHLVEGVADGLAAASRHDATAIVAGSAVSMVTIAYELVALGRPVTVHADGDPSGILAARRAATVLIDHGIPAVVITYAPGQDPAEPGGLS